MAKKAKKVVKECCEPCTKCEDALAIALKYINETRHKVSITRLSEEDLLQEMKDRAVARRR